jgi:hypothetical protein
MKATAPLSVGEAINPVNALKSFGSAMAPLAKPGAELGAGAFLGSSILGKTPEIIASLPFVGPQLTKLMLGKSGQDIEDLTQLTKVTYPASTLRDTLESAASKFRDNPKLEKILQEEIDIATTKPVEGSVGEIGTGRAVENNVNISKLQNLKEIAETNAKYDKVPTPENNLWKAIANGYSSATKEIQPGLEDALKTYSKWKKVAEDSGDFAKVGKKWIDYGLRFAAVRALWSGLKGSSAKPTIKKIK